MGLMLGGCCVVVTSLLHSKPVPLYLVLSLGLSACARRWAQFRVGLVAWGMESRKESLAIKKISPRPL